MLSWLKSVAKATSMWIPTILHMLLGRPDKESPTISSIEGIHETEKAKNEAQTAAKTAQDLADQIKRDAEQDRERARARQEEADSAAARAAEEMKRMKVQMEEVANAMKRAAELAEASAKAAREDAERFAREAREERGRTQKMHEDAQKAQKAAREDVERFAREAREERERAQRMREDAERAAAAREEAERAQKAAKQDAERFAWEAQEERERAQKMHEDVERAIAAGREEAEMARKASKDDAERFSREAQEERERAQKMRDNAVKAMAAAREEADRAQKVADEQCREAEASKALAVEMARTAAEEARKAIKAKEEAEERLKKGIQPVVTPSPEELAAAKRRIQYREDCFHFAAAGISGSGKSSLVNAFRGLHGNHSDAAAVGVTETTLQMTRYQDTNPDSPFVWYDVPGAGTPKCRDWQYFNDQGLYVFDCIIVLFDNRFTMTDIAILINARRFNIPTYIVRSKADQHIRNTMMEMGYDSDNEEDFERRNRLYEAARKQFISRTRKNVQANLEDANLPNQRVYIVSNNALLSIMLSKMPKKAIDEMDLVNDLFYEAYRRRKVNPVAF